MYILLAIVFTTSIGALIHVLLKPRSVRGVIVSGAIAAATSAALYTACTWIGLGEANIWTWVISIIGAIAATLIGTIMLTRSRVAQDAALQQKLGIA